MYALRECLPGVSTGAVNISCPHAQCAGLMRFGGGRRTGTAWATSVYTVYFTGLLKRSYTLLYGVRHSSKIFLKKTENGSRVGAEMVLFRAKGKIWNLKVFRKVREDYRSKSDWTATVSNPNFVGPHEV